MSEEPPDEMESSDADDEGLIDRVVDNWEQSGDPTDSSPSEPAADTSDEAEPADAAEGEQEGGSDTPADTDPHVPEDVRRYERFTKVDRAEYDRVNQFLRDRTYITAREWAIARLCTDFRTETGVEMTKIGDHLPELVPFMTEPYSPQAVNQARHAFEEKVRKAGATFLYGAMCDFFTAEELDDVLYEATEVARFLLEVEGVELDLDEELAAEDQIATVMREVSAASDELRHEGAVCPSCGHRFVTDQSEE